MFTLLLFEKMKPFDVIKRLKGIDIWFNRIFFGLFLLMFFGSGYVVEILSYFAKYSSHFQGFMSSLNDNPEKLLLIYGGLFIIFFIGTPILRSIFSLIMVIFERKNKKRLEQFGHTIYAKVEDIEMDTYGKDNDRSGWFISLKSGEETFEEMLNDDPFGYLDFGDTIEVLIDPQDKENFYVDLEKIFDAPVNKERMRVEKWKEKSWFEDQK